MTFTAAHYANVESTAIIATSEENGAEVVSKVDHPARWVDLLASGIAIAAYVPPPPPIGPISDRQFAQELAAVGQISQDEALAWAARGELPDRLETAIAALPSEQQFPARMLLSSATTYERDHPLTDALGNALGFDADALDALWRAAALL